MENLTNASGTNENISLHDLLAVAQRHLLLWWTHKWWFILLATLGGGIGFGYAHLYKAESYTSRTTFSLESKSTQFSPAQLLLGGSGGSADGLFSGDNMGFLLNSNRIVEQALLNPGNDIADSTLLNRWLARNHTSAYNSGELFFPANRDRETFVRSEDSLMKSVVNSIKSGIKVEAIGGGILELAVTSNDEAWALDFGKVLLIAATDLYFDLKVGKSRRSLAMLESRLDSVQRAFNASMYNYATEADQSLGLYSSSARIPLAKKEIQTSLLRGMYTELLRSIELTKAELSRDEPVFELIDPARLPLEKKGKGRMLSALIGALILSLLTAVYISGRELF